MSPFDAVRYARLLEGLEVSVLRLSEVIDADVTGRMDSGFFEKRFIAMRKQIAAWSRLDVYAKAIVCGPFGSNLLNENYVTEGIPMIRPFNLRKARADSGDVALLEESFVVEKGLKIFPLGTVMFARVGEIATGVSLFEKTTISPNIIAAELFDTLNPYFLSVFANTRFGQIQLEAGMKVVAQPTISTETVRALRIPPMTCSFQSKIAKAFQDATDLSDQSAAMLLSAEKTLLEAIGVADWQAPEPLSYVRPSSKAFAAGRLDAEYFTPRVLSLMALLGRDGLTIGRVAPARSEKFQASKAGKNFKYIEISDMRNDGTVESNELALTDAPSRATQHVRDGDVLTSTVRPIRRLSAAVDSLQDGAVCSSGFVVLNPTHISTSTLVTYLRLPLVCELMDLHTSASLYPAISEKDLLGLPIPRIPQATQTEIDEKVRAARAAKQRATQLLDAAKRAVEIAIEDNEAAALAYLEPFK